MVFLPQILLTNIICWFGSILRESAIGRKKFEKRENKKEKREKKKEKREKIIEVASRYNFTN